MVLRGEWKRVTVEKQPQVIGCETECAALRKSVWLDSAMQSWGYPGDTGRPPRSCSHPGPTAHSIHTEPPQQTSHYQPIQELQVSQTHNCFKTVDKGNSSRKTIFCNNISLFFFTSLCSENVGKIKTLGLFSAFIRLPRQSGTTHREVIAATRGHKPLMLMAIYQMLVQCSFYYFITEILSSYQRY